MCTAALSINFTETRKSASKALWLVISTSSERVTMDTSRPKPTAPMGGPPEPVTGADTTGQAHTLSVSKGHLGGPWLFLDGRADPVASVAGPRWRMPYALAQFRRATGARQPSKGVPPWRPRITRTRNVSANWPRNARTKKNCRRKSRALAARMGVRIRNQRPPQNPAWPRRRQLPETPCPARQGGPDEKKPRPSQARFFCSSGGMTAR